MRYDLPIYAFLVAVFVLAVIHTYNLNKKCLDAGGRPLQHSCLQRNVFVEVK